MVSEVGNLDQGVLAAYRPPAAPAARELSDPGAAARQDGVEKSGDGFRAFGENGFTFWDFLDIVNPLHHVPVVGHFYRAVTGDEIDPGARIAGGALFGGPIGAAVSVADVTLKHNSGKDFGQHAAAFFGGAGAKDGDGDGDRDGDGVAVTRNDEAPPPRERTTAESAPQAGRDAVPVVLPPAAPPRAPATQWTSFAAVRPINAEGGLPILDPSGIAAPDMTAIPVTRTSPTSPYVFADGGRAVDSFYRARAAATAAEAASTPRPAIDENAERRLNAGPTSIQPPVPSPIQSLGGIPARSAEPPPAADEAEAPAAVLGQTTKRPDTEALLSQAADGANRGWMFEAMMRAMDKYEAASQLGGNNEAPRAGVVR